MISTAISNQDCCAPGRRSRHPVASALNTAVAAAMPSMVRRRTPSRTKTARTMTLPSATRVHPIFPSNDDGLPQWYAEAVSRAAGFEVNDTEDYGWTAHEGSKPPVQAKEVARSTVWSISTTLVSPYSSQPNVRNCPRSKPGGFLCSHGPSNHSRSSSSGPRRHSPDRPVARLYATRSDHDSEHGPRLHRAACKAGG
jgi:hypothetical protein